MTALWKPGPFLAVALVTAVLLTPLCGLLHCCGCTALWSGGESSCNVRLSQGPHCPWCEHRLLGAAAAALILGGQAVVFRFMRQRSGTAVAMGVAFLALAPVSVLAGAVAWLPTDYPHFLVRDARTHLRLPKGPIPCIARGTGEAAALCCPGR